MWHDHQTYYGETGELTIIKIIYTNGLLELVILGGIQNHEYLKKTPSRKIKISHHMDRWNVIIIE